MKTSHLPVKYLLFGFAGLVVYLAMFAWMIGSVLVMTNVWIAVVYAILFSLGMKHLVFSKIMSFLNSKKSQL